MKPRRPRGRLSLHRETLRSLNAREMAGVAGGITTIDFTGDDVVTSPTTRPRTNAWTSSEGALVLCGLVQ